MRILANDIKDETNSEQDKDNGKQHLPINCSKNDKLRCESSVKIKKKTNKFQIFF